MCPTFLYIPETIVGIPVFGIGLALGIWLFVIAVWFVWTLRHGGWKSESYSSLVMMLVIALVFWKVFPFISERGEGVPIRGYGTMVLLGVCAGGWLSVVRAKKKNVRPQVLLDFLLWGIFPGILGGRLWHVVQYWPHFRKSSVSETLVSVLNVTSGGLVMYGALIGALAGWTFFALRHRQPLLRLLDIVAPAMLLGLAFGRIGCLMFGCCFGGTCDLPWAVRFPAGSPAWSEQLEDGLIPIQGITLTQSQPQSQTPWETSTNKGVESSPKPLFPGEADSVTIATVASGSEAEQAGARPGMRILACNGYRGNLREIIGLLLNVPTGEAVQLTVEASVESTDVAPSEIATAAESTAMESVSVESTAPITLTWASHGVPAYSLPVHPTQLYQSIDAFILCLFVLALTPLCRRDGMQLAVTLTIYPISRFLLEMIRVDEKGQFGTTLSIGQWTSVFILIAAMGLWYIIIRRGSGDVSES